jgi:hypothetical protein
MKQLATVLVSLFMAAGVSAEQKDVNKLRAEAAKAQGAAQGMLYAELAEELVNVANQQFTDGDSVKGQATVQEILQHAVQAHDLVLKAQSNRKEVEIHLRRTQRHLEDVKRTLPSDDRPPLDAAEKKLADLRQDLLDAMFAAPKKENK